MKPTLKVEENLFKNKSWYHKTKLAPSKLFKQLVVIFDQTKLAKKNTQSLIYQEKLSKIQDKCANHSYIYTEESKDSNANGYAAVSNNL